MQLCSDCFGLGYGISASCYDTLACLRAISRRLWPDCPELLSAILPIQYYYQDLNTRAQHLSCSCSGCSLSSLFILVWAGLQAPGPPLLPGPQRRRRRRHKSSKLSRLGTMRRPGQTSSRQHRHTSCIKLVNYHRENYRHQPLRYKSHYDSWRSIQGTPDSLHWQCSTL